MSKPTTLGGATGDDASAPMQSPDHLEELRAKLSRAVGRVCPAWLRDRSDDVIQAAMVKLRAATGGVHHDLSSAYLHRVAYTSVVDEIRRLRRRREVSLDDPENPLSIETAHPNPEEKAMSREIGAGILDCLTRMKRERRLAVTLYLQGHRGLEVAALLGWSAKKAENLTYRGLDDLRNCLEARGLRPGEKVAPGEDSSHPEASLASGKAPDGRKP